MEMPNVLLQLANANPMMVQIKQMIGMVQTAKNPQNMINQMAKNNPIMKQAFDIVNQHGGNVNEALAATEKQYGISRKDLMKMMKF